MNQFNSFDYYVGREFHHVVVALMETLLLTFWALFFYVDVEEAWSGADSAPPVVKSTLKTSHN